LVSDAAQADREINAPVISSAVILCMRFMEFFQ